MEVGQYDCIIFCLYIILCPLTQLAFNINLEEDGMLEDPENDGKIKNSLSFKGTVHKTQPLFMLTKQRKNILFACDQFKFAYFIYEYIQYD